jgi:methyl-accepting chemotaxis protein
MEDVVGSVRRVTDLIGEIAAASEEQRAGIEQVNQAITQMDQVTQQNAALVEQAAAAADSMQEQAHQLAALVGTFQTGQAVQAPARPAVAAKPRAALAVQPVRKEKRGEPVVAEEWETF